MKAVLVRGFVALVAVGLLTVGPTSVLADGGDAGDEPIRLELLLPETTQLGATIRVEAILTAGHGAPVEGAVIEFYRPVSWGVWGGGHGATEDDYHADGEEAGDVHADGEEAGDAHGDGEEAGDDHADGEEAGDDHADTEGEMELGTGVTNAEGLAFILYEVTVQSELEIRARFAGNENYDPVSSMSSLVVTGGEQLYTPRVGIRVPLVGSWILMVVLGTVWGLLLIVGFQVYGIARSQPAGALATTGAHPQANEDLGRRDFVQRVVVPLGMLGFIGAVGAGLQGILIRNPDTHRNLQGAEELKDYTRTPFASVGIQGGMKPLPPVLDRKVSFTQEVLPIFVMRAGPHSTPPKNSPPPGGILLDSYEHIMDSAGLVVPGAPEQSHLVEVLRSEVMYMPPIRTVPLPEDQVQLIVSWIAQGAENT